MEPFRWFLRMARWAHRPPSQRMVILVIAVIALSLGLAGLQHLGLWPDGLQVNGRMPIKIR